VRCQLRTGKNAVCGLSYRNSIHENQAQFGYHTYVPQKEEKREPTLEERVERLEKIAEWLREVLLENK
jgi:hypothetical protein